MLFGKWIDLKEESCSIKIIAFDYFIRNFKAKFKETSNIKKINEFDVLVKKLMKKYDSQFLINNTHDTIIEFYSKNKFNENFKVMIYSKDNTNHYNINGISGGCFIEIHYGYFNRRMKTKRILLDSTHYCSYKLASIG
jgi:hypothetical protein